MDKVPLLVESGYYRFKSEGSFQALLQGLRGGPAGHRHRGEVRHLVAHDGDADDGAGGARGRAPLLRAGAALQHREAQPGEDHRVLVSNSQRGIQSQSHSCQQGRTYYLRSCHSDPMILYCHIVTILPR